MSRPTKSQAHREEGNKFYLQTQNEGIAPAILRGRLEKAMVCYRQALDTSVNSKEKSSALKNIAMTSLKLFTVLLQVGERTSTTEYYLKDGVQTFDLALGLGQSGGQAQLWCNTLCAHYMGSIDLFINHLATKKTKDRCHFLDEVAKKINNKQAKSSILIETARVCFNSSVVALESGDFKSCLSLLGDCHQPLEEAKLCNTDGLEDITELETSVFQQHCRAESLQAREYGDSFLKESINNSETLNMDAVYTVIDFYMKAIVLTKELEIEMEAIARSRLGNLYDCILKDNVRAKQNYMMSLQLAGSLQPRVFHHEEWYKLAALAVERYQKSSVEKEEEERAKERAPYLKELKKELKEIEKHEEKGAIPLLEYIYKTLPPKNKKHKLTELSTDPQVQKKALKQAIVHYHPDKQDIKLHGMKWFVLAEEITKLLTRKYEFFKG